LVRRFGSMMLEVSMLMLQMFYLYGLPIILF